MGFATQECTSELARWEASIKQKDAKLREKQPDRSSKYGQHTAHNPVRDSQKNKSSSNGRETTTSTSDSSKTMANAAAHTYDQGYKKWESFDVDKALSEIDNNNTEHDETQHKEFRNQMPRSTSEVVFSSGPITPGNIVPVKGPGAILPSGNDASARSSKVAFPEATAVESKPRDVLERERGNDYFKQGNFAQAIKFYTRAIGFNPKSAAAYSNRAMALLKLKDYSSSEMDCCSALELDPQHVKSLTRRGTARNALGRHRAAYIDFLRVRELEPHNRQAIAELARTRELIRSSSRRAPRKSIEITRQPLEGLTLGCSLAMSPQPQKIEDDADFEDDAMQPTMNDDRSLAHSKGGGVASSSISLPSHPSTPQSSGPSKENEHACNQPLTDQIEKATQDRNQTCSKQSKLVFPPEVCPSGPKLDIGDECTEKNSISTRKIRISLPTKAPHSMYEFERIWKELQSSNELRGQYLCEIVGESGVQKLFARNPPEADLLAEMVQSLACFTSLAQPVTSVSHLGLQILESIATCPSLDMTIMFLSKTDKTELANVLRQAGFKSSSLISMLK
mmetsp:Transcript_17496/g.34397  ORF Transcript_17496/g.34397 Transcript_17496/m.34397 type:complete len:565 (-) Transcript_17496:310-2004(-)